MADEPTTKPPGEGEQPPEEKNTPGPVPYERFKKVNDGYKSLQKRLEELEVAQKKNEDAKLAEQQKWQELAQKREAELMTERLQRLRLQAALSKGLSSELAPRLQGESEADLLADAEKLAEMLAQQKPSPPGVPPRSGGTPPVAITNQQMRDPKWVRENQGKIIQAAKEGKLPT